MLITSKEVARRINVSHVYFVNVVRHRDGFPSPVPAFKRPLKWREVDIDAYVGD